MAKRQSKSVYRRRRAIALVVTLIPVLIVAKACTVKKQQEATPKPTSKPTAVATASTTATATPTPTPTPTTTTPTPKPTIGDCRNSDIAVSVSTDAETYALGSPVTIQMRIENKGTVSCKRDIGALPNEIYVTDPSGLVVWSSDACQTDAKPQVVVMKPGAAFGNTQVWNGMNSGRDCTSAAADAAAGEYTAMGRNDTVEANGVSFVIQ